MERPPSSIEEGQFADTTTPMESIEDNKSSTKQQKMWGDMSESEEEEDEEEEDEANIVTVGTEKIALKIDTGIQADIVVDDMSPNTNILHTSNSSSTQTHFRHSLGPRTNSSSSYLNTPISERSRSTDSSDASSSLDPRAPSWSPTRGRKWAGSLGEMVPSQ